MRALTVRQPWAWAIVEGGKGIENRVQRWSYRGPLAIHAGLSTDPFGVRWMQSHVPDLVRPRLYERGAIIGLAELVEAHWSRPGCCDSPWAEQAPGVAHLVLEQRRRLLSPVATTGRFGLWTPTEDVLAAVLADPGAAA